MNFGVRNHSTEFLLIYTRLLRFTWLYLTCVQIQITYSGAVLEVCMRKLVFYPEIVGFIEEEKDKFPYVKVQYIFNSPPKLIMLDEDGQLKENIR